MMGLVRQPTETVTLTQCLLDEDSSMAAALEDEQALEEEEEHPNVLRYGDHVCFLCEGQLLAMQKKLNLSYNQMMVLGLATLMSGGLLGLASLAIWKKGLFRKRYVALFSDRVYDQSQDQNDERELAALHKQQQKAREKRQKKLHKLEKQRQKQEQKKQRILMQQQQAMAASAVSSADPSQPVPVPAQTEGGLLSRLFPVEDTSLTFEASTALTNLGDPQMAHPKVAFRVFEFDPRTKSIKYSSVGRPVRFGVPVVVVHAKSNRAMYFKLHKHAVTLVRPPKMRNFRRHVKRCLEEEDQRQQMLKLSDGKKTQNQNDAPTPTSAAASKPLRRTRLGFPHSNSTSGLAGIEFRRMRGAFDATVSNRSGSSGSFSTADPHKTSSSSVHQESAHLDSTSEPGTLVPVAEKGEVSKSESKRQGFRRPASMPISGSGSGSSAEWTQLAAAPAPMSTSATGAGFGGGADSLSVVTSNSAESGETNPAAESAGSGESNLAAEVGERGVVTCCDEASNPASLSGSALGSAVGSATQNQSQSQNRRQRGGNPLGRQRFHQLVRNMSRTYGVLLNDVGGMLNHFKHRQQLQRFRKERMRNLPNISLANNQTGNYFLATLQPVNSRRGTLHDSSAPSSVHSDVVQWGMPIRLVSEFDQQPVGIRSRQYYNDSLLYLSTEANVSRTTLIPLREQETLAENHMAINYASVLAKGVHPLAPRSRIEITIGTYNVWMMPRKLTAFSSISPKKNTRAKLIAEVLPNCDVWVFTECFEHRARNILLNQLESQGYYFISPTVGYKQTRKENMKKLLNGGVVLASRYPIVSVQIRLFKEVCVGSDAFADKGVLYCKIIKDGTPIHVFGTHLQAWNDPASTTARRTQMEMLMAMHDQMQIDPIRDVVYFVGDFNVNFWLNKQNGEYDEMLKVFRANDFAFVAQKRRELSTISEGSTSNSDDGKQDCDEAEQQQDHQEENRGTKSAVARDFKRSQPYSFDPRLNALAASGFSSDGSLELLDYILVSKDHRQPVSGASWVQPMCARTSFHWKSREYFHLSDHFPVMSRFVFDPLRDDDSA